MNMDYCKWENTGKALDQCLNDIEDFSPEALKEYYSNLSEYEKRGFVSVLNAFSSLFIDDGYFDTADDMQEFVEDF